MADQSKSKQSEATTESMSCDIQNHDQQRSSSSKMCHVHCGKLDS